MSLTIVNRNDNSVIGEITNKSGLISAMYRRKKENDEMSLDIELVYTDSHLIRKGNSIVIEDEEGKLREFDIDDYEEIDGEVVVASCLPTYLNDLGLSKPISKTRNLNSLATEELLNSLLSETNWQSGNIYSAGSLPFERDNHEHPLELIKRLAEQRQLVADYYIEISFGRVTSRKVDLRLPEVIDNGKEVRRGKDLHSLKRRESLVDTRTAVQVIGSRTHKEIDAEGNEVDVETELMVEVFNDEIQNKIGRPGDYKWDILESDSDNEEDMVAEGNEYLQEVSKVYEEFEIDVEDLGTMFPHETVQFGDVVHLKDTRYEPVLILKGEIVEVEYDISDKSTKKYLIGEAVRLKTRLDDIEDIVDKYSVQINQANDFQRKIIDRLVDISGPIKGIGEELVYKNELKSPHITIDYEKGGELQHFNYNRDLKITSKSDNTGNNIEINTTDVKGTGSRLFTLRFRARANTTLKVRSNSIGVAYAMVDGNRLTSEQVDSTEGNAFLKIKLSGDGWKTVEIVTTDTSFRFETEKGGEEVRFEDFQLYRGTPIYSERSLIDLSNVLMNQETYITGGHFYGVREGNTLKFHNDEGPAIFSGRELARIPLNNTTGDVSVKNVRFKLRVIRFGDVGVRDRKRIVLTGISSNMLVGHSSRLPGVSARWIQERNGSSSAYEQNGAILLPFSGFPNRGLPVEYEIDLLLAQGPGTGRYLDINVYAERGERVEIEIEDIVVLEGLAPSGVVIEGGDREEEEDLSNQMGIINQKINQKADKVHKHTVSDIEDFSSDLDREATDLGYAKTEDVENMTWEMERIRGLITALNNKSNVGHGHLISEIDGLQEILSLLSAGNGEGGDGEYNPDLISLLEGLNQRIDEKANISHTHTSKDIDGLDVEVNQKLDSLKNEIQINLDKKANTEHTHSTEDIVGLGEELNQKLTNLKGEIQLILDKKANTEHTHSTEDIDGLDVELNQKLTNLKGEIQLILDTKSDIDHVHNVDEIVDLEDYINQGGGEVSQRYEVIDIIDHGNYQEIIYFDNDWGMQYTFTNEVVSGAQYEVIDIQDYGDYYEISYLDTNWGEVFNITIPKDGSSGGNGGTEQPQYEIVMVDERFDSTDLYINDNYNGINHLISVPKNSGGGGGSGGRYSVTGITDLSYSKSIQFLDNELGENVTLSIPTDGSMVSGFDFMMYKRDMTRQLNILRAELGLEPIEEEGPGGGPAGPGGGPASS